MQFKVVKDLLAPATPKPAIELMIRVIGDCAYLCARPQGHSMWVYLLVLGHPDGARLFPWTAEAELRVDTSDGALKVSDIRACVTGLPS